MTASEIPWGPSGELVYDRTYSRTKADGSKESWPETVKRVVDGNLGLVDPRHHLADERADLIRLISEFKIIPGGRHLWASGVKGRQYLFNCHVAGWGEGVTEHFEFTFLRLMEGGGVGANYSNRNLAKYPHIHQEYRVHIVCDPDHPDYEKMNEAGVLSAEYDSDWEGSFEVEDSREGWASALVDLISVHFRFAKNERRVFDVSRVRAEGARLKTFGGRASGPLPLAVMLHEVADVMHREFYDSGSLTGIGAMEIDHAIAKCVVSGGNRRSARMSIMHWSDPQIGEFLRCKQETGKHWTTNISVELDDYFFETSRKMDARAQHSVLLSIAEGMLSNGEPGIWNSTYANIGEPNEVIATNPCGEICLEPWENCNLGNVNLAAFVGDDKRTDSESMRLAHRLMTRFLMRATYGDVNDEKQAAVLRRNRRIGVGHFGVASFLALKGVKYSEAADDAWLSDILDDMAAQVDNTAREYAHELRIPVPVKNRTVAPTGTIAKLPGVSEGIHPIFARYFTRRIRLSTIDPEQFQTFTEYALKGFYVEPCRYAPNTVVVEIPTKDILLDHVAELYGEQAEEIVQSAADLTLVDMLNLQALYQKHWADNAVSYTANVDPENYTVNQICAIIQEYGPRVKGMTVFPETSMPQAPYERLTQEEYESYSVTAVSDSVDEECASGACPVR